jgi:hypothetical protein
VSFCFSVEFYSHDDEDLTCNAVSDTAQLAFDDVSQADAPIASANKSNPCNIPLFCDTDEHLDGHYCSTFRDAAQSVATPKASTCGFASFALDYSCSDSDEM